jgi:DNA replication protein DnaC
VTCPTCADAGYYRVDVPVGHPLFGRAIRCDCLDRQLQDRQLSSLLRLSNLDSLQHLTFDNFHPQVAGVRDAFQAAREFADDPKGWLILAGPYGCGKTHLAVAIAHQAMKRHIPVLFQVVPDLLDHLRATFAPQSGASYDQTFEAVRTTHLLVLDDLGEESDTRWAQEKLYQLFNHRYNYRLPTVVTTNRPPDAIDDRIRSRMYDTELSRVVVVEAADFRRTKRSPPGKSGGRR